MEGGQLGLDGRLTGLGGRWTVRVGWKVDS